MCDLDILHRQPLTYFRLQGSREKYWLEPRLLGRLSAPLLLEIKMQRVACLGNKETCRVRPIKPDLAVKWWRVRNP